MADKVNDSKWIAAVGEAKAHLIMRSKTCNDVKCLYVWLQDCVKDVTDMVTFQEKLEYDVKRGKITKDDFTAFSYIICQMVTTNQYNFEDATKMKNSTDSLVAIFKKRIWIETDMSKVMQFRNCVTDMYMLEVITLEEYIALNNEIDRYIQYRLTSGDASRK